MDDGVTPKRQSQSKIRDDICALDARIEGVECEVREDVLKLGVLLALWILLALFVLFRVVPRLPQ